MIYEYGKVDFSEMKVTIPEGMDEEAFIEATKKQLDEAIRRIWEALANEG